MTLRTDVFNLFNRTNFGVPERDLGNPSNVGRITTLAGAPRVLQFFARVTF